MKTSAHRRCGMRGAHLLLFFSNTCAFAPSWLVRMLNALLAFAHVLMSYAAGACCQLAVRGIVVTTMPRATFEEAPVFCIHQKAVMPMTMTTEHFCQRHESDDDAAASCNGILLTTLPRKH